MVGVPDISVLIPTRDRAASLGITLDCLSRAACADLKVEIVVIDNGSTDETCHTAESYKNRVNIQYLCTSAPSRNDYGKALALNCALDLGGLAGIIAVLDDDMSPHPDWFQAVSAICRRWLDKDIFTGRSYIIWPSEQLPGWAKDSRIRSWAFSVMDQGNQERVLERGRWFSGNHVWFRSRVFAGGRRLENTWNSDSANLILQLVEDGYEGIYTPEAVAGHRIQPSLLDETIIRNRAIMVGRTFAAARLRPYKSTVKQAVYFKRHPILSRLFCLINSARWLAFFGFASLRFQHDKRFLEQIVALERLVTYWSYLRVAPKVKEYRLFGVKAG
jgi:glycosyltransferase involved in cell wall biosynthesis